MRLGLALLRFVQNRYEEAKPIEEKNLLVNPRTGKKREATNDYFLTDFAMKLLEEALYDCLVNLLAKDDIARKINNAMKLFSTEYLDPDLQEIMRIRLPLRRVSRRGLAINLNAIISQLQGESP